MLINSKVTGKIIHVGKLVRVRPETEVVMTLYGMYEVKVPESQRQPEPFTTYVIEDPRGEIHAGVIGGRLNSPNIGDCVEAEFPGLCTRFLDKNQMSDNTPDFYWDRNLRKTDGSVFTLGRNYLKLNSLRRVN